MLLIAIGSIWFYQKWKIGSEMKELLGVKGNYQIQYHFQYKGKFKDTISAVLNGVDSGVIEGKKENGKWNGELYFEGQELPVLQFYKDGSGEWFDIGTSFTYFQSYLNKKGNVGLDLIGNLIAEGYVSRAQLMYLFDVETTNLDTNTSGLVKQILKIKTCESPDDLKYAEAAEAMEFYTLPAGKSKQSVLFGMNQEEKDLFYLIFENQNIKMDLLVDINPQENVQVERPNNCFTDKEVERFKETISAVYRLIE